jgi:diphosphomevalonate decarboxylase
MSKHTVSAPANIAFIKYWGASDLARAVPLNSSISMTLEQCVSQCTVEILSGGGRDEIWLAETDGRLTPAAPQFAQRILDQVERLRAWAGRDERVRIATHNTFPAAAGLASSASGFAALTLAVAGAFGRPASPAELSLLARKSGSGSACRSVLGGYVEWQVSPGDDDASYAAALAGADHWDLRDVIAVVEIGPKTVSSLEGHKRAPTSPYYSRRRELLGDRLARVRQAIRERDLGTLGPVLEEEAIDLHLIAMSSHPPIFYWSPGTVDVLRTVRELRQEGLAAWATMDAGANVHVICDPDSEDEVAERLGDLPAVGFVIRDGVGDGPEVETQHLF